MYEILYKNRWYPAHFAYGAWHWVIKDGLGVTISEASMKARLEAGTARIVEAG